VPPSAADALALGRLVAVRLISQLLGTPQEAVQWVRAAPFLTPQQQQVGGALWCEFVSAHCAAAVIQMHCAMQTYLLHVGMRDNK
jgi:hypothetical protein